MSMSIHVKGPFGGCDEQAETDAFERLCGGHERGFRLLRLYQNCRADDVFLTVTRKARTKNENFRIAAESDGWTREQIAAFLHLQ